MLLNLEQSVKTHSHVNQSVQMMTNYQRSISEHSTQEEKKLTGAYVSEFHWLIIQFDFLT